MRSSLRPLSGLGVTNSDRSPMFVTLPRLLDPWDEIDDLLMVMSAYDFGWLSISNEFDVKVGLIGCWFRVSSLTSMRVSLRIAPCCVEACLFLEFSAIADSVQNSR